MPIKALPLCPNWDWRECACMNVHSPKVYLWELRHQLLKNRMRREKVTWQFSSYIDSAFLLHVILLSKQWVSIILNNNVYKWHSDQSEVTKIKERDDEDGKRKRKRVVGVMVGGGGGENIIKKKQSKKPIWTVAYVSLTCHWWQTCCPMPFLISILKKTVTNLYFCTKCTYEPQTPVNQNVAITTHWSKCGYHNSLVKMWLSLLTGQNVAITTHWSKCGYHNSLVKMWLSQLTGQNVAIATHLSKCGYHNSPVKMRLSQLTGQNVAIATHWSKCGYHNSPVKTRLSQLLCQDAAITTHLSRHGWAPACVQSGFPPAAGCSWPPPAPQTEGRHPPERPLLGGCPQMSFSSAGCWPCWWVGRLGEARTPPSPWRQRRHETCTEMDLWTRMAWALGRSYAHSLLLFSFPDSSICMS